MPVGQRSILNSLMEGYMVGDIALERGCSYQSVQDQFIRAVERIVRQNNVQWINTYGNRQKGEIAQ